MDEKKIKINHGDKLHPVDVMVTHAKMGDKITFEIDDENAGKIEISSLLFGDDDPLELDTSIKKKSVSFRIPNMPYVRPGAEFKYGITSANIVPPDDDPKIIIIPDNG